MKKRLLFSGCLAIALLFTTQAFALRPTFVGARSAGMAGAVVASVSDTSAQYYNPAAFGFFGKTNAANERLDEDSLNLARKNWGATVGVNARYKFTGSLAELLASTDIMDVEGLNDSLLAMANLTEEDHIDLGTTGQVALRIKNFGIGLYGSVYGNARPVLTGNIDPMIQAELSFVIAQLPPAASQSYFSASEVAQLTAAGYTPAEINALGTYIDGELPASASLAITETMTGSTNVYLSGLQLFEIPFTYGHQISNNFAIGGNIKVLQGTTYAGLVDVYGTDVSDLINEMDQLSKETTTYGIDAGLLARYSKFNLGLVVRNLNTPTFDAPQVPGYAATDVELSPQATIGVAFIPHETFIIEVDYDLLKVATLNPNVDYQNIAIGLEWDIARILALRAGYLVNLEDDLSGEVYTAGLGLNLWAVRFDVAAAVSTKSTNYDGSEVPDEGVVSAQLSVDF